MASYNGSRHKACATTLFTEHSVEALCTLLFTFPSTIRILGASLALSYKTGHNLLKDMVAKNPGKTPNPGFFLLSAYAL